MPLALGGLHEDDNLQILCAHCNLSKSAKPFQRNSRSSEGAWSRIMSRLKFTVLATSIPMPTTHRQPTSGAP